MAEGRRKQQRQRLTSTLSDSNSPTRLPQHIPAIIQADPENARGQEGHSGSEEQPEEVHYSQESDGERGRAGYLEGGGQQGEGQGGWFQPPPQEGWVGQVEASGEAFRERISDKDNTIMGVLEYFERKGGYVKTSKGLTFALRAQTQIRHFGQLFFISPSLLIGIFLFRIHTKDLKYSKQ